MEKKVGIIGGSGLYDLETLSDTTEIEADTPYGKPSSPLTTGTLGGVNVVLLARHGKDHQFSPTQVNYRANIQALKDNGVTHIIATTACGSLRRKIKRGDFIAVDQFIDFTRHRTTTFYDSFENGMEHPAMADPFNADLRKIFVKSAKDLGYPIHDGGTVVTIEGPRFSTRAESHMFRAWGADVINMTVASEAMLANEAAIPYSAVAMSTDYDCWKEDEKMVTWEEILEVFNKNVDKVKQLLTQAVSKI